MMRTRSRSRLWSMQNIPEDLWPEILPRLPAKSLLRFRCVSKSWLALIDDPDFTRSHLSRFNNKRPESHLLVLKRSSQPHKFLVWCTENPKANFEPSQIGQPSRTDWRIVSSMDGLLVLKKKFGLPDIMLWNPSIRKTLILPPYPDLMIFQTPELGLGFDPSIQDYKYIRFWLTPTMRSVAVYTLGTNSWRTMEFQGDPSWPKRADFYLRSPTIYLRGALYSLAIVGYVGLSLVSFDLISEMFASIKFPVEDGAHLPGYPYLLSLPIADGGRSLAVITDAYNSGGGSRSIWVLEGLGGDLKSCSWSKRYTFTTKYNPSACDESEFFYMMKNGEVLFKWKSRVTSYNLETHEEKTMLKGELQGKAWPYLESLVLHK